MVLVSIIFLYGNVCCSIKSCSRTLHVESIHCSKHNGRTWMKVKSRNLLHKLLCMQKRPVIATEQVERVIGSIPHIPNYAGSISIRISDSTEVWITIKSKESTTSVLECNQTRALQEMLNMHTTWILLSSWDMAPLFMPSLEIYNCIRTSTWAEICKLK